MSITSHYPLSLKVIAERFRLVRVIRGIPIGSAGINIEKAKGTVTLERIMEVCRFIEFRFDELCGPESVFLEALKKLAELRLEQTRITE